MKLGPKDWVENVYYTMDSVGKAIEYKGKTVELNKLKAGKRDGKGVKIRV